MRKEAGFEVTDRIRVYYVAGETLPPPCCEGRARRSRRRRARRFHRLRHRRGIYQRMGDRRRQTVEPLGPSRGKQRKAVRPRFEHDEARTKLEGLRRSSPRAAAINWSAGKTSSSCAPTRRSSGRRSATCLPIPACPPCTAAATRAAARGNTANRCPPSGRSPTTTSRFKVKPMGFKHTGLFPEQAVQLGAHGLAHPRRGAQGQGAQPLRLYGRGDGRLRQGGRGGHARRRGQGHGRARGRKRAPLGHHSGIRYIVDDCKKFVQREIRRGNSYDAIIMDPPSYGRGPGGEMWKIEESLFPFVQLCAQVLSDEPLFFLINSYTTGCSRWCCTIYSNCACGAQRKHRRLRSRPAHRGGHPASVRRGRDLYPWMNRIFCMRTTTSSSCSSRRACRPAGTRAETTACSRRCAATSKRRTTSRATCTWGSSTASTARRAA